MFVRWLCTVRPCCIGAWGLQTASRVGLLSQTVLPCFPGAPAVNSGLTPCYSESLVASPFSPLWHGAASFCDYSPDAGPETEPGSSLLTAGQ